MDLFKIQYQLVNFVLRYLQIVSTYLISHKYYMLNITY